MNRFVVPFLLFFTIFFNAIPILAQQLQSNSKIPPVYTGIMTDNNGQLYHLSVTSSDTSWQKTDSSFKIPSHLMVSPTGVSDDLVFDFKAPDFYGTVYYGVYPDATDDYLYAIYSKSTRIIAGTARINLKSLINVATQIPDTVLKVQYRLADQYGNLLYDGCLRIKNSLPVSPLLTLIEGPFISNLEEEKAVVSFTTNQRCAASVVIDGIEYTSKSKSTNMAGNRIHEIQLDGLNPETTYNYEVHFGSFTKKYCFPTAPLSGSRKPFCFAFTSNSQGIPGGGEWDLYGVNANSLKHVSALASNEKVAFFQFSGNLIKGFTTNPEVVAQQYHNWKKSMEILGHQTAIYTGMGNHEAVEMVFSDGNKYGLAVDNFPFATASAEAVFTQQLVNPENGPISEDNSKLDPYLNKDDFPKYTDQVYSYRYDNLAVLVLNSNYWSTPSAKALRQIGGNPPGYIMDNQLEWVRSTLSEIDSDKDIDNVIVVMNSPVFPIADEKGMWNNGYYYGSPVVAAEVATTNLLERRDELLDVLVNQNKKVALLLTSTEFGYARLEISPKMPLYIDDFKGKKLKLSRSLWQISCGLLPKSPFLNEKYPWSGSIVKSSRQTAVVFVQIDGENLSVKVLNPFSLEVIETALLK